MKFNKLFYAYVEPSDKKFKLVFILFGLKLTIALPYIVTDKEKLVFLHYDHNIYITNKNLVNLMIVNLKQADETDLLCLKNEGICYIFNKKVLQWGINNFVEFIYNAYYTIEKDLLEFSILNEFSPLYQEHLNRTQKGEFLWKYTNNGSTILQQYLSYENDKDVYIYEKLLYDEDSITDNKNFYQTKVSKRKYIEGITVQQYIQNKTYEEKKEIIISLINYIFNNYAVEADKIDGTMIDCHLRNFVIDKDNKFNFIDKDCLSTKPIEKEYVVNYLLLHNRDKRLQKDILKHFGYKNIYRTYKKENQSEINPISYELEKKYFLSHNKE